MTQDATRIAQMRQVLEQAQEYAVTLEAHIQGLQDELKAQKRLIADQKVMIERVEAEK